MISILSEADELKRENKVLHSIESNIMANLCEFEPYGIKINLIRKKKGLFPKILKNLLNMQNKMKAELKLLKKKKEYMELVKGRLNSTSKSISMASIIKDILFSTKDTKKYIKIA